MEVLLYFNPRSLAGATKASNIVWFWICISIHAPLRERRLLTFWQQLSLYFNPRSLAGATAFRLLVRRHTAVFQSTLPCGSDLNLVCAPFVFRISIHAPLRERHCGHMYRISGIDFNPRSLAGATVIVLDEIDKFPFQSTLPCGSDMPGRMPLQLWIVFQSTLPCGSDGYRVMQWDVVEISIHAPLRERPISRRKFVF